MERGLHYPLRGSQIGVPAGASTDIHRRQGTRARVTSCAAAISAEQPRADSFKARLSGATAINTKEARADNNKAHVASRDAASLSAGEARADINKNARRPPRRRLTQRGRGPRQHKQKTSVASRDTAAISAGEARVDSNEARVARRDAADVSEQRPSEHQATRALSTRWAPAGTPLAYTRQQ